MERYKLIQTYPYSPKLGTIVEKYNEGSVYPYRMVEQNHFVFTANSIENFPENWQKVTEEVKSTTARFFNPKYVRVDVIRENNSRIELVRVTRLFDNVSFSIGDKIEVVYHTVRTFYTIKEIIHRKEEWFTIKVNETSEEFCLTKIRPYRQELFVTHDNVKVRENDTYWYILPLDTPFLNVHQVYENKANINDKLFCPLGVLQFADKNKAYAHMIARVPCISILDVAKVFKTAFRESTSKQCSTGWDSNTFKLLKIVEKKLKANFLKTEEDE